MLKETVSYEDFDGNKQIETLYFNLSKTELMEQRDLRGRLQKALDIFEGEKRDLTEDEIYIFLDLIKELIRISYGVRSEDGKRFSKTDKVFDDFRFSAAYDAYLFSLFENPEKVTKFVQGILPKGLREEAEKSISENASVTDLEKLRGTLPEETGANGSYTGFVMPKTMEEFRALSHEDRKKVPYEVLNEIMSK